MKYERFMTQGEKDGAVMSDLVSKEYFIVDKSDNKIRKGDVDDLPAPVKGWEEQWGNQFPIAIDYYTPKEIDPVHTGTFVAIENDSRTKRALNKNENQKSFIRSLLTQQREAVVKELQDSFICQKIFQPHQRLLRQDLI